MRPALSVLLVLPAAPLAAGAQRAPNAAAPVVYDVAFPNAAHHEARITATFTALPPRPLELRMSRSSPGRYAVHEFAKNVYAVAFADSRGQALHAERPNPHQWNVGGHDGTVRVTYTLFGDRADGTYAGIDRTQAHLNTPATFMYARGLENRPVRVTFHPPDTGWTVATQLAPTRDSLTFTAPHLQYFLDSPSHLARQSWWTWPVSSNGRPYTVRVALHHAGSREDAERYVDGVKRIVAEAKNVFGEYADFDFDTYTFIAAYLPWASGDGMEHRNSTSVTSAGSLAQNMAGLLGTVSHEFFHSWNVERIRPATLEPFDFADANISGELWLAEGFTSYYGPLIMRRAGLTTVEAYARALSGNVDAVTNDPGRRFHSAVGMSRQAPFVDAAVSIDPQNKGNTFISYYTYGAALGLALDLSIRQRSPGKTLDDFMREMWRAYGKQQANYAPVKPYTLDDVRRALGRAVGDAAWADDFFSRFVAGRELPDYRALLAQAGFTVRKAKPGAAWLGDPPLRYESGKAIVGAPTEIGSPLYEAGVDRNDRIVSLDGRAAGSEAALDSVLAAHEPGDAVPIVYESRGTTRTVSLTLAEDPHVEVVASESAGVQLTEAQRAFRERWVGR
jgi:predicted metalloprotease with PDZ domain